MKKLWLTYAWKDNEDKDVDFIIQELDKTEVKVRFDRRELVPGLRLWQQIGGFITDPNECDAWGILLTANSLRSEPCMEELYYAIDRALSTKGESFPVFALLHHISAKDLPPALKIRLGISLAERDWVNRVVAAVHGRSPGFTPETQEAFVLREHSMGENGCLEIRPRFERIAPFLIAVDLDEKTSGNVTGFAHGPANTIAGAYMMANMKEYESKTNDGELVWVWTADNEASSVFSYFLLYKKRPKRVWYGHPTAAQLTVLHAGHRLHRPFDQSPRSRDSKLFHIGQGHIQARTIGKRLPCNDSSPALRDLLDFLQFPLPSLPARHVVALLELATTPRPKTRSGSLNYPRRHRKPVPTPGKEPEERRREQRWRKWKWKGWWPE